VLLAVAVAPSQESVSQPRYKIRNTNTSRAYTESIGIGPELTQIYLPTKSHGLGYRRIQPNIIEVHRT